MSAKILDGKSLAQKIQSSLRAEVEALKVQTGQTPRFVNITVGDDPSAGSYARSQLRAAEAIGVRYEFSRLSDHVTQTELIDHVKLLNDDPSVHGIMLHKPLPAGIDFQAVVNHIAVSKDMEGVTEANLGRLLLGTASVIPATPAGAMALLASSGVDPAGKNAVVVGRSEIVGKPVMLLLMGENATTTVCHSATSRAGRLEECVKNAEILVVAMGKPNFIPGEWVREGAVVIDIGINAVEGKLVGDVEYASAVKRAGFITPVPGGVGPVTAVMLMKNGIATFKEQMGLSCQD